MKVFLTLVCWSIVTACFAQQSPDKKNDNLKSNVDNMPILRDHSAALYMPTRKGEALPMPTRPVPLTPDEQVSLGLEAVKGQLKHWPVDSLNRIKPDVTLPDKKN